MPDLISVIETAYRADLGQKRWLEELVASARPFLDDGFGVWATLYDASTPQRFRLISPVGAGAVSKGIFELLTLYARRGPAEHIERTFGRASVGTLGELLGQEFVRTNPLGRLMRSLGIHDSLGINGADPSGRGCVLSVPLREVRSTAPAVVETWSRLAAHIASGLRLRRHLEELARDGSLDHPFDRAEAILDPDGHVQHAVGGARTPEARAALRGAAVALDRARARLRRQDPAHAVALWNVLVDARWTIVDHFDRDGRRYLIAERNEPEAGTSIADRAGRGAWARLTPQERKVAGFAALGHTNKLIAYTLGLTESTVATHLSRAAAKLGITSRVEWVQRFSSRNRA